MDELPLIAVVVGAHLKAEREHRPLAYFLRARLLAVMDGDGATPEADDPRVAVCTDLWYVNREELSRVAAVSIGGPEVNALTAHLASRLPSALAIEGRLVVQADASLSPPLAAAWGVDASSTGEAVRLFAERYGESFARAAGW